VEFGNFGESDKLLDQFLSTPRLPRGAQTEDSGPCRISPHVTAVATQKAEGSARPPLPHPLPGASRPVFLIARPGKARPDCPGEEGEGGGEGEGGPVLLPYTWPQL
jgi:hypothetical protein